VATARPLGCRALLLAAAAGAVAAAVAIPIFAFGDGGGGESVEAAAGNSLGILDRASWVANAADGTVDRVDLATRTVRQTVRVGNGPAGIAVGEGSVWVANGLDGTVSRIDPR
jgi:YVTN family beta-propeller protein